MKNNLAPRSSPQLPEAIVAGIALWLLVIPVLTAQEESFEKVGEPYTMQAKPSQPGQSVGEVMLDEGGIEILWRVHYRFFEPVKAGQDTDRDGIDDVAEANADTPMPGFTHLQVAQPVTFGHHLMAYYEMSRRDAERFADCRKRTNRLPLGSAALDVFEVEPATNNPLFNLIPSTVVVPSTRSISSL